MEVIFILLPLAILIAGVMLALFIWAVRSGQYDDLETPAHRILFDEDRVVKRRPAGENETPGTDPKIKTPQAIGSENP